MVVVVIIVVIIIVIIVTIIDIIILIITTIIDIIILVVIVTLLVQHALVDSQTTLSTFDQQTGSEAPLPELFGLSQSSSDCCFAITRTYKQPSTVERHQPTLVLQDDTPRSSLIETMIHYSVHMTFFGR